MEGLKIADDNTHSRIYESSKLSLIVSTTFMTILVGVFSFLYGNRDAITKVQDNIYWAVLLGAASFVVSCGNIVYMSLKENIKSDDNVPKIGLSIQYAALFLMILSIAAAMHKLILNQ